MSNDFYVGYFEDHYFEHHGILGQKWGDKNGPPYPLDPGDHSAKEKKAGWVKSLKNYHAEKKKKKQRKKALEKARVAKAEKAKQAELQKKFEADKEKVLRSGKASEILKYKGQMTNDEMEYAIQRINKEERLYGLSAKEQQDSWQKIDKIFDKVGTITNWVNKAANAYSAVDNLLKKFNGEEDDKSLIDRLMKSGDLKEAYENRDKMTADQLSKVMAKAKLNKQLDEEFGKNDKESKGDSIFDKIKTGAKDLHDEYKKSKESESKSKSSNDDREETSRSSKSSKSSDSGFHYDPSEAKAYVNSLLRGLPDSGSSKSSSSSSKWYDYDGDVVDLDDYFKKSNKSSSSSGSNWWSSSSSGADSFKKASDAVDDFTDELLKGNADRMSGKKKKKKK